MEMRDNYLRKLEGEIRKNLETAPAGTLRISRTKGKIQYYHRKLSSDPRGVYISRKQDYLIKSLAQKEYEERCLKAIQQERKAIAAFIKRFPACTLEAVYDLLSENRKAIVTPLQETDEAFLERWESVQFKGKDFPDDYPELLTEKGERVRSKSEMIIANILAAAGIPYRYECPVRLKGMGWIFPDFTVLDIKNRREMYWEHFGMMDDPEYAEKAVRKIAAYNLNEIYPGEHLIMTMETKSSSINVRQIKKIIARYFG